MALGVVSGVKARAEGKRRRRARWPNLMRRIGLPIAAVMVFIVLWDATVRIYGFRPAVLPTPGEVLYELFRQREILIANAVPTTVETLSGFALSVVLGTILGILLTYSRIARDALYPNVVLFQLIPKVAVAPLFMLWLGIDWPSRLAIALFIAFFPIVLSTTSGLNSADPALLRLCRSLTASEMQIFFKVRLPSSLPFIFNGMKISMTLAIIGVIIGEFITSQDGLGYVILFAGSRLDTGLVIAAILVLCAVGLVLYGIVAVAEHLVSRKYGR